MPSTRSATNDLSTSLDCIKGIGPATAEAFAKRDLRTVEDLLMSLPVRYEDRREFTPLSQTLHGQTAMVKGRVIMTRSAQHRRQRKTSFEVTFTDDTGGFITARWFNANEHFAQTFRHGDHHVLFGQIVHHEALKEMIHPELLGAPERVAGEPSPHWGRIVPIYSDMGPVPPKKLRSLYWEILRSLASVPEVLPAELTERLHLPLRLDALKQIHFPSHIQEFEALNTCTSRYHKRLIFEELFLFELDLALRRNASLREDCTPLPVSDADIQLFLERFPFPLTSAQQRAWSHIRRDLEAPHPMNRLLQGDVGSGKTIVAALAALAAVKNGKQCAIMAPTEVLASQHAAQFERWFGPSSIPVKLLKGGTTPRLRRDMLEAVQNPEPGVFVGTHALIQPDVQFSNLGLAIIDEQHRFGVHQRMTLRKKGPAPHVLVVTATPIPRTLSMTLYGDLDLSIIDELPPGRTPIETRVIPGSQEEVALAFIRQQVEAGRQAYIVFPLIEESESSDLKNATLGAAKLQAHFQPYTVALLHGKMKAREKEDIISDFRSGRTQILVSTTVIEVGIDVPNASIMLIENAERFGLSQLHQLRGRVGRGAHASTCFLMNRSGSPDTGDHAHPNRRLRAMALTTDGFRIAELDLEIRGPGELLGTRQAGYSGFRHADIIRHTKILEFAREEAFSLVARDPSLAAPQHKPLKNLLDRRNSLSRELIRTG